MKSSCQKKNRDEESINKQWIVTSFVKKKEKRIVTSIN